MGIAAMTDRIAARFAWMPAVLRDPFAATIAAEAATWPLMLANFHQLSLIGPVANALVLPLLGSLPLAAITMPYFPPRWIAAAVILNGGALAGVKLRQFFWRTKVWLVLGAASMATGPAADPARRTGACLRARRRDRVGRPGADRERLPGPDRRRARRGQVHPGHGPRAAAHGEDD
jgi:hypothetical protein